MARKKSYRMKFVKVGAGVLLLLLAVVGLSYWSLLREMERAAAEYNSGDTEAALKRYDAIEARLQSVAAFPLLPQQDQKILVLNEARLLYELGTKDPKRYDEAAERLERGGNNVAGLSTDGRYLILRGNLAFRKAVENYRASEKKDPQVLEEALLAAEDNMRNSLKANSGNWDAKYNYEYVNYIRNLLSQAGKGKMNILMENVRPKEIKRKPLTPEQMG